MSVLTGLLVPGEKSGIEATAFQGSGTCDYDLPSLKSLVFEIEGLPWLLLLLSRDRVDISKVNPPCPFQLLTPHKLHVILSLFLLDSFLQVRQGWEELQEDKGDWGYRICGRNRAGPAKRGEDKERPARLSVTGAKNRSLSLSCHGERGGPKEYLYSFGHGDSRI